jgi:two-component system KDP operon response regulator KdpE
VSSNPVSVLVVDDEPPIRRFLRTSLAGHNYRITEAESGQAALDILAREKPDLVILDLGLPDMEGIEVLRRIRATSRVPVVVLSSRGEERVKVEALELGADDYVTKPFGMAELKREFAPPCATTKGAPSSRRRRSSPSATSSSTPPITKRGSRALRSI